MDIPKLLDIVTEIDDADEDLIFEEREEEQKSSSSLKEEIRNSIYVLPEMLAVAFACVLEDTADKISLIGNMSGLPRVTGKVEFESLEQRFGKEEVGGQVFDSTTLEPIAIALEHQKLTKFQTDRNFVQTLLKDTVDSLFYYHDFDSLMEKISQYRQMCDEEAKLLGEAKQNRIELATLQNLFQTEKEKADRQIEEKSEQIGKLKDEIEDILFENHIKMRYIEKWENSRVEQNSYILTNDEESFLEKIKSSTLDIERETRINSEIEAFINETQRDHEASVQEWMEKYDTELEQLDLDITITKNKIEEQEYACTKLKEKFEDMREFIERWIKHKQKKRKEALRRAEIDMASIKIQCWWRGVMVRKKLGPYGKKKGGGGKK